MRAWGAIECPYLREPFWALDKIHGLCHRQRSHHHGSQGFSFLIQALHKGQDRVHIGFSFIGMRLQDASLAHHPVNPVILRRKIADTKRGEIPYLRGVGAAGMIPVLAQHELLQRESSLVSRHASLVSLRLSRQTRHALRDTLHEARFTRT